MISFFYSDNWVKQVPGSSAKVLCPHSYPRDLLSNQELLQEEDYRCSFQQHLGTELT